MKYLLVAAGGALGSVARYGLDGFVLRLASPYFPSGTFVVNAVGCLVFGAIMGFADGRSLLTPTGRLFLLIGLLGGFTTFSTFTFETFQLVRGGEYLRGALNAGGQVVVGYLGMWAGYVAVRSLL
ncbi:MAG: fluoride efflux transporter FluC [Bacteroidales bacterium]